MQADREGDFKASILEHNVNTTGPNDLTTFICGFLLVSERVGGDWEPVEGDLELMHYFYLENRDSSLNDINLKSIEKAFGWDNGDMQWLQDTDFSELLVRVTLEFETFDGKTRLKVRYLNHVDSVAGIGPADSKTMMAMQAKLGAKLRARRGGVPRPAPAPQAGTKPKAAPTAKPAAASRSTKPPAAKIMTQNEAWVAFNNLMPGANNELIESEWFRIRNEVFPKCEQDKMTPTDWAAFIGLAPKHVRGSDDVPF